MLGDELGKVVTNLEELGRVGVWTSLGALVFNQSTRPSLVTTSMGKMMQEGWRGQMIHCPLDNAVLSDVVMFLRQRGLFEFPRCHVSAPGMPCRYVCNDAYANYRIAMALSH